MLILNPIYIYTSYRKIGFDTRNNPIKHAQRATRPWYSEHRTFSLTQSKIGGFFTSANQARTNKFKQANTEPGRGPSQREEAELGRGPSQGDRHA